MATNELLPFANGEDANVLPTAQWQALTNILQNGFQSGIARSEQVNRVLAQGAVASYVLGQLIVDQLAQNATLDETTLYQNLILALQENAKDACLPLVGGTMFGTIKFGGNIGYLECLNTDGYFQISGAPWGSGARITLYGKDHTENGAFSLLAQNAMNSSHLHATPGGPLTWDGHAVSTIVLNGNTFIRYDDGTQICWGRIDVEANQSTAAQTFPLAFANTEYAITITTLDDNVTSYPFNIGTRMTTGFTAWCRSTNQFDRSASWIAIGRWR